MARFCDSRGVWLTLVAVRRGLRLPSECGVHPWDLSSCSSGPHVGLAVERVAVEALPPGALSSGHTVAHTTWLIGGCPHPSPTDDRPGLDPAGRVLLPRPVEHPRLCGGGRCTGGLRFGVSNSLFLLDYLSALHPETLADLRPPSGPA